MKIKITDVDLYQMDLASGSKPDYRTWQGKRIKKMAAALDPELMKRSGLQHDTAAALTHLTFKDFSFFFDPNNNNYN